MSGGRGVGWRKMKRKILAVNRKCAAVQGLDGTEFGKVKRDSRCSMLPPRICRHW